MIPADKTLAAIDAAIVANQEPPHRKHLGASLIGKPCDRKLWYSFRWAVSEKFKPRMLRLFNRGHLEEARFVGFLRDAGVEVWEAGENGDNKASMRVSYCAGHFGGTPDGIALKVPDVPENEPCLLEFKTHGSKSFAKLKDEGLMRAKWEHFVQMQIYMKGNNLKWGLYLAVDKDTDEIFGTVVQFDEDAADKAIARAQRIIFARQAPAKLNQSPAFFECKFCAARELCHGKGAPERNCRTCIHCWPDNASATWHCQNPKFTDPSVGCFSIELSEGDQRAGCKSYELDPAFFS